MKTNASGWDNMSAAVTLLFQAKERSYLCANRNLCLHPCRQPQQSRQRMRASHAQEFVYMHTHQGWTHTPPTQGDTSLHKCCQAGQCMGGLTPSWKVTGFDPRISPTCIINNITALLKTYSGWSITVTWCAFFFGTPLNGSNSVNYKSNIKKTTVIHQTRWISADYVDRGTTAL